MSRTLPENLFGSCDGCNCHVLDAGSELRRMSYRDDLLCPECRITVYGASHRRLRRVQEIEMSLGAGYECQESGRY